MLGPHLPLALTLMECPNKGCWDLYGRMFKSNNGLLTSIPNNWTMKLYLDIAFVTVQNSFITCRRTTPYIFSRFHFEIIYNRVMTDTLIQISR